MAQSTIIYNMVGGTDNTVFPNIQGSAISRNLFSDINGSGDNAKRFLQSCPGIKLLTNLSDNGTCDGMFVPSTGLASQNYEPSLFVAVNGNIFKIDKSLNSEIIGTYSLGKRVQFAESGGERAILLWVDGNSIQGYDLKEGNIVSITLPKRLSIDEYIQPSHISVVSGSIVLNDVGSSYVFYSIPYPLSTEKRNVFKKDGDGNIVYKSDGITVDTEEVDSGEYCFLDDYGVRQYFNAESSSDKCVAISSVGALLTLFGPSSIEFWQKGDSESYQSWQRTSYTVNKEQGLEAPYSLASVNHIQFCIGTGKSNGKCVMAINDTNVQKISPLWLDKILNENDVKNVVGWTYSLNNHSFYLFSIGINCYCYDATTNEWHLRSSRNFYNGKQKNYMPLYSSWWDNKIIVGCCENGNIYTLDTNYFYEDYTNTLRLPILRTRQTPVITSNYKPFIIYELALECNAGVTESYGNAGKVLLQKSDDGGYTFGNVIESSIGRRGEYFARVMWLNLGMSRQCVLKVSYSEPTDFVISDSSIRFSELATSI